MTLVFHQKNAGAQTMLMEVVTICPPPTSSHPQTVQLTAILTDTQVLQVFHIQNHPRESQ